MKFLENVKLDFELQGGVIRYREEVSIRYNWIFQQFFPIFLALLNEKLFFENFDCGGVPAVGGLKFSMAQKKSSKKCQLGEVPVGG